jgi:uncharacterized protein with ATP-grasp and redox domains
MHTTLDCIPCFLNQALKAARIIAPDDSKLHQDVLMDWISALPTMDLSMSPPALAGILYARLTRMTETPDIFSKVKEHANADVQTLLPGFRETLATSSDPLFDALRLSIIGNYMDVGTPKQYAWGQAMEEEQCAAWSKAHYPAFKEQLATPRSILILGDNAGEIVLDTLLVDELNRLGHQVTYAVRGTPILNDATMEDAVTVGMTQRCEVISSGVDTPGTVLERCTSQFLARMDTADIIISKGQGNFEALKNNYPGIYFAFKIKCPVIADIIGRPEKTSMFEYI